MIKKYFKLADMKMCLIFALLTLVPQASYAIRGEVSHIYPKDFDKSVVQILKVRKNELVHVCSGTILNHNTILTAAHCFDDKIFQTQVVYQDKTYHAQEVKVHADYHREDIIDPDWGYLYDIKIKNDLALIKTHAHLPPHQINIMEDSSYDLEGQPLFISGFGQTANIFGLGSGEGVYRVSLETHIRSASKDRILIEDGISGACQGDSGGPLWVQYQQTWRQLGVTSQGDCNVQTQFERISTAKLSQSSWKTYSFDIRNDD